MKDLPHWYVWWDVSETGRVFYIGKPNFKQKVSFSNSTSFKQDRLLWNWWPLFMWVFIVWRCQTNCSPPENIDMMKYASLVQKARTLQMFYSCVLKCHFFWDLFSGSWFSCCMAARNWPEIVSPYFVLVYFIFSGPLWPLTSFQDL